jgi:hypothetical protein
MKDFILGRAVNVVAGVRRGVLRKEDKLAGSRKMFEQTIYLSM